MASARQIAANRRNAQKSGGPKSEEGKQRSSMNALRHDSVCAVWMIEMSEEKLRKLLPLRRLDRAQYYRAIAALEKAQAARFRREQQIERTLRNAHPDAIAELSPEPPPTTQVSENGNGSVLSQPEEKLEVRNRAAGSCASYGKRCRAG